MKWSDKALVAARPVYEKILEHPFLHEMLDGSLPREKFIFYLRQDALYLADFGRALAIIAGRLDDLGEFGEFIDFARDTMMVERALHEGYLSKEPRTVARPTPSCLLYSSYVQRHLWGSVEVALAAVLPCFRVYKDVGDNLLARSGTPGNPYQEWINTYGGEEYAAAVRSCQNICDKAAEQASPVVRAAMTEVYGMGVKMEWMFWQSAYSLEGWPV